MSNIHTLHTDKRWKAVVDYNSDNGTIQVVHYLEELIELHLLMERGPDWNTLERCTLTLNRHDGGEMQERRSKVRARSADSK